MDLFVASDVNAGVLGPGEVSLRRAVTEPGSDDADEVVWGDVGSLWRGRGHSQVRKLIKPGLR
jgi:hypothetical protein